MNLSTFPPRFLDYLIISGIPDDPKLDLDNFPLPSAYGGGSRSKPNLGGQYDDVSDISLLTTPYKPLLLDRYPSVDHPNYRLPAHISMFVFPRGVQAHWKEEIKNEREGKEEEEEEGKKKNKKSSKSTKSTKSSKSLSTPDASFFTFVLTEVDGSKIYGASLTFYEIYKTLQLPSPLREACNSQGLKRIWLPKNLCLLSHWPFFAALRGALRQIYVHSKSPSFVSIERIICNLMNEIPLPPPGRLAVQYSLPSSRSITRITRPPITHFPLTDFPFRYLFQCLDVDKILTAFAGALLDDKLIFVSSHYSLLTYAAETITSLLYPFIWPHVYIPVLPHHLLEFTSAPTPFIMGIHTSYVMDSENLDHDRIIIIDLDANTISSSQPEKPLPSLPEPLASQLSAALSEILAASTNVIHPQATNLEMAAAESLTSDVSFPEFKLDEVVGSISTGKGFKAPPPSKSKRKGGGSGGLAGSGGSGGGGSSRGKNGGEWKAGLIKSTDLSGSQKIIERLSSSDMSFNLSVRSAFLRFLATLLYDYRDFIVFLKEDPPTVVFNKANFLKSRKEGATFLRSLVETQSFTLFVEGYSIPTSNPFDDAVTSLRSGRELDALPDYRKEIKDIYNVPLPDDRGLAKNASFSYAASFPNSLDSRAFVHPRPMNFFGDLSAVTSSSALDSPKKKGHKAKSLKPKSLAAETTGSHTRSASIDSGDSTLDTPLDLTPAQARAGAEDEEANRAAGSKSSGRANKTAKSKAERDAESFMQLILHKVLTTQPVDPSEILMIQELFKTRHTRLFFGRLLKALKPRCLPESAFAILSSLLAVFLTECVNEEDYRAAQIVIKIGTKFYRTADGRVEEGSAAGVDTIQLQTALCGHPIFSSQTFWDEAFAHILAQERRKAYGGSYRDFLGAWRKLKKSEQASALANDENLIFGQIGNFAHSMLAYGVSVDEIKNFVSKMCMTHGLSEDHRNTLVVLLKNMQKANELMASNKDDAKFGGRGANDPILYFSPPTSPRSPPSASNSTSPSSRGRDKSGSVAYAKAQSPKSGQRAEEALGALKSKILGLRRKWTSTSGSNSAATSPASSSGPASNATSPTSSRGSRTRPTSPSSTASSPTTIIPASAKVNALGKVSSEYKAGFLISTYSGHTDGITTFKFDDPLIYSGSCDGTIRVWNTTKSKCKSVLLGHTSWVSCLAVHGSAGSSQLVSGSYDKTVKVWDLQRGVLAHTFTGHTGSVFALKVIEHLAVTASYDSTLRLWDLRMNGKGKAVGLFQGHQGPVMDLAFEGGRIISGSRDTTVKLWDPRKGGGSSSARSQSSSGSPTASRSLVMSFEGHKDWVKAVRLNDKYILSGSYDRTVKAWSKDGSSASAKLNLAAHTGPVNVIEATNNIVVSGGGDRNVIIWDLKTAKAKYKLGGHSDEISSLHIASDQRHLVSGSFDNQVKLWSIPDAKCEVTLQGHNGWISSTHFDVKSRTIISGSWDSQIKTARPKRRDSLS